MQYFMDQLPIELNLIVISSDIYDFIEMLKTNGYIEQSKKATEQFEKQIKINNNEN